MKLWIYINNKKGYAAAILKATSLLSSLVVLLYIVLTCKNILYEKTATMEIKCCHAWFVIIHSYFVIKTCFLLIVFLSLI